MQHGSYALIAFVAGLGVPVMAALNGVLGAKLGSPLVASAILVVVASVIVLALLAAIGLPEGGIRWPGPTVGFLAGVFGAQYIVSITMAAPKIGVGNAVFLVLLGQLISAGIIDHFGLFGAPVVPVSWKRVVGIVVMAVGVFLARKPI